ncbi:hypothetical protein SAMN05421780_10378 [Flexibacter flexilis DSM 6793]|uniref:PAP2 superfamily protein n=1 Tax=Flexibacter flexilis DSM 6793 TaxID=927664 RepID=A0A1I1GXQ2_9BACT|nr:hypothetical protein [Flexibacter flexilis]SFC14638.1 hypothetical protein SAMN05421780_10378 [Flexibacter flexilis DSM 6793]
MLHDDTTNYNNEELLPEQEEATESNEMATMRAKGIGGWAAMGLSVLLHPLLQPTLLFGILFYGVEGLLPVAPDVKKQFLLLITLFTFGVPMLGIYLLHLIGYVRDLHMTDRRDRIMPMVLTTAVYLAISWMFFQKGASYIVAIVMGTISVALLLTTVISLVWKISAHAVGAGGVLGCVLMISYVFSASYLLYPVLGLSVLLGLLLSARLYLNAHTPAQVWAGFVLGFVVATFSTWYFL